MRRILPLLLLAAAVVLGGCGGGQQEQPLDPSDPATLLLPRLDAHAAELAAYLDEGPSLGREQLSDRAGRLATEAKALTAALDEDAQGLPSRPARRLARALRAQHAGLWRLAGASGSFGQEAFRALAPGLRARARRVDRARRTLETALARDRTGTTARTGGASD